MRFHYVCSDCGKVYGTDSLMYRCPDCDSENDGIHFPKGNLIVELEDDVLKAASLKDHVAPDDFYPYPSTDEYEYPIGVTPLMKGSGLGQKLGLNNLWFKLDSQLISGSFKDRASYEVALQARSLGEKKIVLASTGNAGAAASAVAAAMGLDVVLFVPETAPLNKLMQSVLYGAKVIPIKGTYDDAFILSIEYTKRRGGINRNTAYNPMTIEGKKSVSIELFEQMGRTVPDAIYVPVGDGCIIAGVAKGFSDLMKAGITDRVPRLICSQSESSDAISRAINSDCFCSVRATTRADSISVDLPANGRMAASYVKDSLGWAVTVSDAEILEAQLELCRKQGILSEPASACAYACLKKDRKHLIEELGENASVVVLLTGTGFKDMAVFEGKVKLPESVENSIDEVMKLGL